MLKAIEIHNDLVLAISKIKGVERVRELFESPNRYGNTVGTVSFRFNILDDFNFSKGEVSIDYKNQLVFIPEVGNRVIDGLNVDEIVKALKSKYKKL